MGLIYDDLPRTSAGYSALAWFGSAAAGARFCCLTLCGADLNFCKLLIPASVAKGLRTKPQEGR